MNDTSWQFFIDVGGTFTDVVAYPPRAATVESFKLLSSGAIRGTVGASPDARHIVDPTRRGEPDNHWRGYRLRILSQDPNASRSMKVVASDGTTGMFDLDRPLPQTPPTGMPYELRSHEEAPIVAIRYLMRRRLDEPIGRITVRLGTTRGTNALLERKGANVAFVTTAGFGDILTIGNQDRPALFDLHIQKRQELFTECVEVDERLTADGTELRPVNVEQAHRALADVRSRGVEALAICLLHAHVNPRHEEVVEEIARDLGFEHISRSSRLSRLEKIVSRGDTTVADAYLSPVIAGYVAELCRAMPEASLYVMTSAGGLVAADQVTGKDTVLSGPAGGVVGCAFVTKHAGFDRAIGFDMGGTSTDVCRVEPHPNEFEYQQETVKAGVRIMTPMLAIETVAAGGGSICRFDGQKLVVGPDSAGADPGPACYGRGGPLTVTDMNLHVGRIVAEAFPFALSSDAVTVKLAELADEVQRATGTAMTSQQMARGFLQIANANMAAAIKRISIAKGYDVRDYVLTSFGGAGSQHACAIARQLGIGRVLCSPFAGVLSAWGIGVADVKRIAERSVALGLSDGALATARSIFDEMYASPAAELAPDEDPTRDQLTRTCTMDLCYAGQSTCLTVALSDAAAARADFEAQHERLYGYVHAGRAVEIRTLRLELARRSASPDLTSVAATEFPADQPTTTTMWVDGKAASVPVRARGGLDTGERIDGPAVILEDTSTIVIDPGWVAEVCPTGDLLLVDHAPNGGVTTQSADVDPVRLELFNNQFAAAAEQMGTTLRRTALSTNVKERLDFSCAVFTPEGDLVVNAPHIPVHLGGMSECVKCLRADVGAFQPGDVYVTNDPYRGGSHLNDITVITPVFDAAGRDLLFFVASRAHHAEIGGKRPGSMPPDSKTLADEGVLIRAFRWLERGRAREEALRTLLRSGPYPSRCPDENLADIAAQVAANQTGVRELLAMIDRSGLDVVQAYMQHIQSAAENKVRAALTELPDGVHAFEDQLDNGATIRLAVTIQGDTARFDFTGTDAVLPGNLNANRAIVSSAVLYCLRCLIGEDVPLNAGMLAPVELVLPPCFLNPPAGATAEACPAVAGGNVETSQRICDTVFGALKLVAASQGTMNNVLLGDASFGYYETICGGAGAGPDFDGADAVHTNMTNTRLTDPEVLESRYPVRLVRFGIRRGSGGTGKFHGGDGVIRELEMLRPLEVSIISQRRVRGPYGLDGGGAGSTGRNILIRAGRSTEELLGPIAQASLEAGDRLIIETPGGGGWSAA